MDAAILRAMVGLDVFEATFHAQAGGDPVPSTVARDTLELTDEFGSRTIESGAAITYLRSQVGDPKLGDWWEFDGSRWVIENKSASQDSSMRVAQCRREALS